MLDDASTIHMFWHGGGLPPLAHACIRSFVSRSNAVRVHVYDPLALPAGAVLEDARDVIAADDPLQQLLAESSVQAFADCFRYECLYQRGGWWADTDVYCLTDHLPNEGLAWAEEAPGRINNAILRFPKGDPLCQRLAWLARCRVRPSVRWGALGPDLATEVLSPHHAERRFGSRETFYPLHWLEAHLLWQPDFKSEIVRRVEGAAFLHCWAETLKQMGIDPSLGVPAKSYLAEMLRDTPGVLPLTRWQDHATTRRINRFFRRRNDAARSSRRCLLAPREAWAAIREQVSSHSSPGRPILQSVAFRRRAAMQGARLPPGDLRAHQQEIDSNPRFFMERAEALGPIFKVIMNGAYTTCVLGHKRGIRLVTENEDSLPGFTLDLNRLFPVGALRAMTGDTHHWYRRQFIHAIQATPLSAHQAASERIIREGLAGLARASLPLAGDALRDRLRQMTTRIMFRILFGVCEGSPEFVELETNYRRFGPSAPVYSIQDEHARTFVSIAATLRRIAEDRRREPGGQPASFLSRLNESGTLDETLLGNLAYLFEPSHFDLYSLWHWMLVLLAADPKVAVTFASEPDDAARRQYAEAIVLETLRMQQGELLYRRVTDDIVFDGFLIPSSTNLRVCIWEGHKDAAVFPDPFKFDPARFLGPIPGREEYAPFGFGAHHCIGTSLVIGLSVIFVQHLLDTYRLEANGAGPEYKGAYHWQPSQICAVRLISRVSSEVA